MSRVEIYYNSHAVRSLEIGCARFCTKIVYGAKGCSKHSRRFAGLEACFLLVTVVFFCSYSTNSD